MPVATSMIAGSAFQVAGPKLCTVNCAEQGNVAANNTIVPIGAGKTRKPCLDTVARPRAVWVFASAAYIGWVEGIVDMVQYPPEGSSPGRRKGYCWLAVVRVT